jgi:transcription termination factor Rho
VAAEALEKSVLDGKDKEQLFAIAQALGIKTTARAAKATLIDKILESTRTTPAETDQATPAPSTGHAPEPAVRASSDAGSTRAPAAVNVVAAGGEPLADWEVNLSGSADASPGTGAIARSVGSTGEVAREVARDVDDGDDDGMEGEGEGDGESRNSRRRRRRRNKGRGEGSEGGGQPSPGQQTGQQQGGQQQGGQQQGGQQQGGQRPDRSQHTRFDRTDRGEREPSDSGESLSQEPVKVSGYLDLRDEGYGFLRVNGYLPSREDAYVQVKLTRQYGLRKGDHVTGLSRPAGRNEKNPAMIEIHTVNGRDPETARDRPRFEDLTALFPDKQLRLENPSDPNNMTARIIDLISPIGKGQRGIIVSPPKAGKTTIMKTIATSIEHNHPEVKLIVLLIDERPEEVTDMRRTVKGEVISSTFDRPSDEHTHVAELTIERAKRLVELGEDVVIILDGITRLSRAYNLVAPASGRILSGGIDAGALYPPKKFFGAARNVEEGGSLTILATALVETNSRMDDAIFEEFKGTGNMELRLDRKLSERRVYPAIDVDASSTRHEELLFDRKQLQMVWKLRRVLSGLAADGNSAPGLELLVDRLKTFRTNDEFLNEIGKQPSM